MPAYLYYTLYLVRVQVPGTQEWHNRVFAIKLSGFSLILPNLNSQNPPPPEIRFLVFAHSALVLVLCTVQVSEGAYRSAILWEDPKQEMNDLLPNSRIDALSEKTPLI